MLLGSVVPLPPGEGGAEAPGEGNPPHDFDRLQNRDRGAGCPHPALRATFSQREKEWLSFFSIMNVDTP
jgi:hypothetical protein